MSKTRVVVYTTKPDDFTPEFVVVGCLVEVQGEILILLRQKGKLEEDTWGPPAGKVEGSETLMDAMLRELLQETGYHAHRNHLQVQGTLFARYPDRNVDIEFHVYSLELPARFNVRINKDEHQGFAWVTPDEALTMELIGGFDDVLRHCYFRS